MNKAYQFRIYPNQAPAILINKTIGCCRFVFNHFLSLWDHAYKETGKGLTYGTCSAKSREVVGHIVNATVRRNPSGRYFVSLLVETEVQKLPKTSSYI